MLENSSPAVSRAEESRHSAIALGIHMQQNHRERVAMSRASLKKLLPLHSSANIGFKVMVGICHVIRRDYGGPASIRLALVDLMTCPLSRYTNVHVCIVQAQFITFLVF
jgi:hypothetical protein